MIPFQQLRHWRADNFTAAQDDGASTNNWHTTALDQFDATVWSARDESSQVTYGGTSFVFRVQTERF